MAGCGLMHPAHTADTRADVIFIDNGAPEVLVGCCCHVRERTLDVRSTSSPAICGAIKRRCRSRRGAGCRPRLLAIPPFKSERARVFVAGMSAFSGCSTTSAEGASLRGARPGAEDRVSFGQ